MKIRSIGFFTYSARRSEASGATAYVNSMRDGLKGVGVQPRILAAEADDGDPDVVLLPKLRGLRRAAGLLERAFPQRFVGIEMRAAVAMGAARLARGGGAGRAAREPVAIVEVEEHAGLAGLAMRVPLRCPVAVRLHGPHFLARQSLEPWGRRDDAIDRLERDAVARAAILTAPSRDVLERVRRRWGLDLPNARVVPNITNPISEDACWGGRVDGPILFVGRFDAVKGADLVVRAFGEIARRHPERELWLVGPARGLVEGGRRYETVESYLAEVLPDVAVRARVKVLGQRTSAEIAPYRRQCGCVVVASRYETFCLAASEAMMAGCPVIAADAGALPELVEPDRSGLLFAAGDASALAAALSRLFENPELARSVAAEARHRATARYLPAVVIPQMLDVYEAAVD